MIKLFIKYNSFFLKKMINKNAEELEAEKGCSLADCFKLLKEKYGDKFLENIFNFKTYEIKTLVLVNGSSVNDINYKLKDKDVVNILSLPSGG